jgi:hypothetical protein
MLPKAAALVAVLASTALLELLGLAVPVEHPLSASAATAAIAAMPLSLRDVNIVSPMVVADFSVPPG